MEYLQPERQLLSSLKATSEKVIILLEQLKILHKLDTASDETNKTAGVSDSPAGSTDYLEYSIFAKALVDVARAIEEPNTPLCIAVYGKWGTGKSKMGILIEDELKNTITEKDESQTSLSIGFIWLCWNIRTLMGCRCRCLPCYVRNDALNQPLLTPEEKSHVKPVAACIAFLSLICFPLVIVWYVVFLLYNTVKDIVSTVTNQENIASEGIVESVEHRQKINFAIDVWNMLQSGRVPTDNNNGRTLVQEGGLYFLNTIILITSMIISCVKIAYEKITYTNESAILKCSTCNDSAPLPIVDVFKMWEYSGTDSIWAAFIDKLYVVIEERFTPDVLTSFRAAISSGEIALHDKQEEKQQKCLRELRKLDLFRRLALLTLFSGIIIIALCHEYIMTSIFVALPLFTVSFFIFLLQFYARYIATEDWKKVINVLRGYNMKQYVRQDFTEQKGFIR